MFRAATSIVSYALILNFEQLPGTIYVSTAVFGIFRYAMNLIVGLLDYFVESAGRRFIHNSALAYIILMLGLIFTTKMIGKLS